MRLPRLPLLSALLVLLLAVRRCTAAALLKGSGRGAEGRLDGRSMLELIGRYQRARTEPAAVVKPPPHAAAEGHPRDPRVKERFIKHLTGPIFIKPKCKKHFNRLYYSTRDCTIPAYYKRCALLLTRLAKSPNCL
ncbi:ALK and LTK ligand 2-like [Antennarius striatus]|uniref:ALK and LTK ligand 2-like n=1 Tax=Antennarius striatus TaxID=241820 RepID=UPI0035AFC52D